MYIYAHGMNIASMFLQSQKRVVLKQYNLEFCGLLVVAIVKSISITPVYSQLYRISINIVHLMLARRYKSSILPLQHPS